MAEEGGSRNQLPLTTIILLRGEGCMYIHICICTYTHTHTYIYVHIHIIRLFDENCELKDTCATYLQIGSHFKYLP